MADSWESYFQPGETLLWEGTPKPGVYGWPKIIGLALFGIPFLFFGLGTIAAGVHFLFFAGGGWSSFGFGLFLAAFGIPFTGAGMVMVFGQWWAAVEAHRRIRYAVSTRCAYIAKAYRTRSIESYPILKSSAIGLEKARHADTVWFHVLSERDSDGDRTTTRISFDNIADGEKVYAFLRSIQTGTA